MASKADANPFSQIDACALVAIGLVKMQDICGTHEECCAVLSSYLPNWNGKADTVDDLLSLFAVVQTELPRLVEAGSLPALDQILFLKAFLGVVVKSLEPRINAGMDSYFRGLQPGDAIAKLLIVFVKSMRAKSKGGRSTVQWTSEVDAKAREIFAELKRSRMKNTPAYQRTAAKLHDFGFEFSASTVRRHLKNSSLSDETIPALSDERES